MEGLGDMATTHTAPRKRRAPKTNGDAKRSIGRPTMFAGKDLDRHRTTYLTPAGWAVLEKLRDYHSGKVGFVPSDGDIFEDAIHARAADVFRKR